MPNNDENIIKSDEKNELNIEEIMQQIRLEIENRGIQDKEFPELIDLAMESDELLSKTFNYSELKRNISYSNYNWGFDTMKPIKSHRRLLGKISIFLKKIARKSIFWYTNPIFEKQREFNSSVTRSLNEIQKFISNSIDVNSKPENDIEAIKPLIKSLEEEIVNLKTRIYSSELNLRSINEERKLEQRTNIVVADRLRRIENEVKKEPSIHNDSIKNLDMPVKKNSEKIDIDYLMFEEIYRGSEEELKEKQKSYLKYFEGKDNILDIGCGKGEFLELLISEGKQQVKGIDLNKDMIYFCQDRGLIVEQIDALSYLQKCEDSSLEGIFMAQVIEHLEVPYLLELIKQCRVKLKDEGVLIMETINPQCLSVFSNSFYMDLSHNKPVHPLTIKFLVEAEGYHVIDILYLSEITEKFPQILGNGIENAEDINKAITRLNNLLYGYQDYAIVVRK